jgi:hypothetical protein
MIPIDFTELALEMLWIVVFVVSYFPVCKTLELLPATKEAGFSRNLSLSHLSILKTRLLNAILIFGYLLNFFFCVSS